MRCVVIVWDVTHVKAGFTGDENTCTAEPFNDMFVFGVNRQQHSNTTFFICTLLALPIMFRLDEEKITVEMTAWSK